MTSGSDKAASEDATGAFEAKSPFNNRDKQRGLFNFLTWSFFIAEALGLSSASALTGRPGDGEDRGAQAALSDSDVKFAAMPALASVASLADGPVGPQADLRPLDDAQLNGGKGPAEKPPLEMPNIDAEDGASPDAGISSGGGDVNLAAGDILGDEYNFTSIENNLSLTEINISDNDTTINIDLGQTINQAVVVGLNPPGGSDPGIGVDLELGGPGGVTAGVAVDLGGGGIDVGLAVGPLLGADIGLDLGPGISADVGLDVGGLAAVDFGLDVGSGGIGADIGLDVGGLAAVDVGLDVGSGGLDLDLAVELPGPAGALAGGVVETVESIVDAGPLAPVVNAVGGTLSSLLGSGLGLGGGTGQGSGASQATSDVVGSGSVVLDAGAQAATPEPYEMFGDNGHTEFGLVMTSSPETAAPASSSASSGGLLDAVGSILGVVGGDAGADTGAGNQVQNVSLPSVAEEISVRGLVDTLL